MPSGWKLKPKLKRSKFSNGLNRLTTKNNILFKGLVKRDGEWSKIAHELLKVKMQLKVLELMEEDLSVELITLSKGVGSFDESGMVYKPYKRKGNIQYELVPQLHNVDLEPYRRGYIMNWKLDQLLK